MRKSLLLFALALAGISRAGSWTEPTIQTVSEYKLSTEAEGDTTYYYLYNTGAQMLVTAGGDYSTQAVLDESGSSAYAYCITQTESGYQLWSPSAGNAGYLFRRAAATVFTDYSTTRTDVAYTGYSSPYWQITSQGGGVYRFTSPENDEIWGTNGTQMQSSDVAVNTYCMGYYESETNALGMLDPLIADDEGYQLDWAFVSADDYELYSARMVLYNALNSAEEAGVSTTSAASVYASSTSVDELEAATAALKAAMSDNAFEAASESNPVDITDLVMTNADFSEGSINGWTRENSVLVYASGGEGTYPNSSMNIPDQTEYFDQVVAGWVSSSYSLGDENIYQTLSDLPAGKYVFTCSLVAQHGTDMPTGVYLYATDLFTTQLECQHDATQWAQLVEDGTTNQLIMHPELTVIHTGGDLTVGLKLVSTNCNWVYAGKFQLYYYGASDINPYELALATAIANAEEYASEDYVYSSATRATLTAAISSAQAASGNDDIYAAYVSLNEQVDEVKAEIAVYTSFAEYVATVQADATSYDEAGYSEMSDALSDLYEEVVEHLDNCDLTAEEAQAYIDAYQELLNTLLAEAMDQASEESAIDVTSLYIQNADLSDGSLDPWVNTTGVLVWNGDGFPNSSCNVADLNDNETFTYAMAGWVASTSSLGDEEVYQVISDLPKGSYIFSCSMVAQHGTDMPTGVYVYTQTNGLETTTACQHDATLWEELIELGTTNQLMIHPQHTFYHLGGDLVVGVRLKSTNCNWVYASNFTLSYAGASLSALYKAMLAMRDQAEELSDQAQYVTKADQMLNAAILEAEELSVSDGEDAIIAAMEGLQAAIEYTNEAIELMETLEYDYVIYTEYLMLDVESDEPEYTELIEEIAVAIEDGYESKEQIEEYIAALKSGFTAYVQYPVLETSSEDEPGDITAALLNADFTGITGEGSADYWTVTTNGGTNSASYSAYECYNNTAFSVSQTVSGLADGYYRVRCQGFYRAGTTAVNAAGIEEDADYGQYVNFFANGVSAPLCNIVADAKTAETGETGETSAEIDGVTLYMPNSMYCASVYFAEDLYWNQIDLKVDGGQITLGLNKSVNVSADWTMFNAFELYYLGTSEPVGVEGVAASQPAKMAIYDLAGRQVTKTAKGIYIVNGAKVLVK